MKFLVLHPSLAKKTPEASEGSQRAKKRKTRERRGKKEDSALCEEMLVSMAMWRHVLMCMMTSRIHILLLLLLLLLRLLAGCWQCVFLHAAPAAVTCQAYRRSFVLETWESLRGLESNLRETSDTLPVFKHGSRARSRNSAKFTPQTWSCRWNRVSHVFLCYRGPDADQLP